jgi:pyruvate formate lyase activating enzyme
VFVPLRQERIVMTNRDSRSGERLFGKKVSRRQFIRVTSSSALVLGALGVGLSHRSWFEELAEAAAAVPSKSGLESLLSSAPVARYWISSNSKGVSCLSCHKPEDAVSGDLFDHGQSIIKCMLCAQGCVIREGERGGCRARANVDGTLRSLVYGRPVSIHVDPIEKKPFYHFLPGSEAFSLATAGCPLHCKFCQNWEISQSRPEDFDIDFVEPATIVKNTEERHAPIIAFTYNEPTVFVEYFTDIARIARTRRLCSVLVSCGFMNEEPLTEMCSVLDAIKIDLKGFSEEFYRRVSGAELKPVLRSIKQVSKSGVHLEIVNLVVPTLNDSDEMLKGLVGWVMNEVGPDIPIHFTRFHPDYQLLNLPPTPIETLEKAYQIAKSEGIHYPFVGNVPGHPGNNTYCPKCGKTIVSRSGFFVTDIHIKNGRCEYCNEAIAGVWTCPY